MVSKISVFWVKSNEFVELQEINFKFHKEAEEISRETYEKYSNFCKVAMKVLIFIYIGPTIFGLFVPVFVYILNGNLILPYGFKLPWFDECSVIGYAINYIYQIAQAYFTIACLCCFEGVVVIKMIMIYCVFDDLCWMLQEVDEEIKKKEKEYSTIAQKLNEIIKKHQKLLK